MSLSFHPHTDTAFHMKNPRLLFAALSILGSMLSSGQPVPVKENLHIYLLMGQSNMVGRDTRQLAAQVDNPRVLAFTPDGKWVVARDPIHPKDSRIEPGAGPGVPFAKEMSKVDPKITIGLVPCAVGGTPLKRWVKGGDLYAKAIEKAKAAAKDGVIHGVLWHQGEADTGDEKNAATYQERLAGMIRDLRADLGQPDLPVVVGQLGEFLAGNPGKYPFLETVRSAIQGIPLAVPYTRYADSTGLGDKGDKLHFSADAQNEFGARYAKAMLSLTVKNAVSGGTVPVIDVWPEGKMPGKGAREPEANKSPERTDATRITNVSRPTLSVFPAPGENAPAVVICPGGGYSYVVVDKEGSEIAAWLNSIGITGVVLKYRNPNNRAGALQDVQRAVRLVRSHAKDWNVDAGKIGVMGFSAGGHLCANLSTNFETAAYPDIDEIDKLPCRPDFAVLVYPAYLGSDGRVSPELPVSNKVPPTLIVHSEDDAKFVPGSKLYDAALTKVGVPHEYALYQNGGHGYGLHCEREAKAWPERCHKWLREIRILTDEAPAR